MAAGRGARGLLGALLIFCTCIGVLCDYTLTAKEGESVEFKCDYSASIPSPRMEWKVTSGPDTSLIYYDGELIGKYKTRVDYYDHGIRLNLVSKKDGGEYSCEVSWRDASGNVGYSVTKSQLVVLVPPSVPTAQVPTSVSTGSLAILNCVENDGSPPPTFAWYRNNILMPIDPKTSPTFQNTSYTLNPTTGQLRFDQVMKSDIGEYSCEATNSQGKQKSVAVRMEVNDVNVGGIVAAVIVSLLILALIAFAVWFAYRRGYIGKKSNKKVIYSQPSETRSDKNFQQTSSFLV